MKKNSKHSEIKGFFLIAASLILFLSLLSFDQFSSKNLFGTVGHIVALIITYLFGLGSYPIAAFFMWKGYLLLKNKTISSFKTFCFFSFLISFCMLLNVVADYKPDWFSFLQNRVPIEASLIYTPKPKAYIRHNLGGVPLYYFYKDLPILNLNRQFGASGVSILFSIVAFASLLLFTELPFLTFLKALFLRSRKLLNWLISYLKTAKVEPKTEAPKVAEAPKPLSIKLATFDRKEFAEPQIKRLQGSDKYNLPSPIHLSNPSSIDHPQLKKELKRQAQVLEETLKSFGIEAQVGEINCGPTITSFEVQPAIGVKVQQIKTLANDIALNMQAKSIRIIAPIPGKAAVGVEVPSLYPRQVSLKEMLLHYNSIPKKMNIPILLGKTVTGESVIADLAKMPHCLIAGATGSGKSVCINTIVMSILMNSSPEEIKLLMIDPKKVELTQYSKLPHMIAPVITESHGAYAALQWLVKEMQNRYDILKYSQTRNITAFNMRKNKKLPEEPPIPIPDKLPLIVAIIDEFADLMMVSSSDLETPVARIAQMARAVGIHLILATQRPSREVITGIIKANFPCRIAFKVASRINSQIILDEIGAESLLGNGDLLFQPPGSSSILRAQGAFISDEDINKTISSISEKYPPNYIIPSFDAMKPESSDSKEFSPRDELYDQALMIILETKNASTTFLQRKLKIGYARAASLIDELEANGIVSPPDGSKPRRVLKVD